MKFIVAPDSFKECMTAQEAASVISDAILHVFGHADIEMMPLGDGGEGTMVVLADAAGGMFYEARITGPLGQQVTGRYAILGDGKTAVVEMAQASGLQLIPPSRRNPLVATTYGTGELMKETLKHPIEHLIVLIGGSATNDGGAGMLQALGVQILDDALQPVKFGGDHLSKIRHVDMSGLDPRIRKIKLSVACDVNNPFAGPNGASRVFAPQKGANPETARILDDKMRHFADVIKEQTSIALHDIPGSGAAGGLGGALLLCGGNLVKGIDLVLDVLSLERQLPGAHYIFTGEGRIDHQTPDGKVVAGLVKRAAKAKVPVIALAGSVRSGYESLYTEGLLSVHSITHGPCSLEEALKNGKKNLFETTVNLARLIQSNHKKQLRAVNGGLNVYKN